MATNEQQQAALPIEEFPIEEFPIEEQSIQETPLDASAPVEQEKTTPESLEESKFTPTYWIRKATRAMGISDPEDTAFGRGVRQGVTFGFADETEGVIEGIASLLDGDEATTFKGSYRKARDLSRGRDTAAQEEAPGQFLAGELTGGLATALVAAPVAATKIVATAATTGGRIAAGIATGAGAGALDALGHSEAETFSELAQDTAEGAKLGATIGGAIPGVAPLAKRAVNPLKEVAKRVRSKGQSIAQKADVAEMDRQLRRLDLTKTKARKLSGGKDEAHGVVKAAEEFGLLPQLSTSRKRTKGIWDLRSLDAKRDKIVELLDERAVQIRDLREISKHLGSHKSLEESNFYPYLVNKIKELEALPNFNKSHVKFLQQFKDDIDQAAKTLSDKPSISLESVVNTLKMIDERVYTSSRNASTIEDSVRLSVMRDLRRALRKDELDMISQTLDDSVEADGIPGAIVEKLRNMVPVIEKKGVRDGLEQLKSEYHNLKILENWLRDTEFAALDPRASWFKLLNTYFPSGGAAGAATLVGMEPVTAITAGAGVEVLRRFAPRVARSLGRSTESLGDAMVRIGESPFSQDQMKTLLFAAEVGGADAFGEMWRELEESDSKFKEIVGSAKQEKPKKKSRTRGITEYE